MMKKAIRTVAAALTVAAMVFSVNATESLVTDDVLLDLPEEQCLSSFTENSDREEAFIRQSVLTTPVLEREGISDCGGVRFHVRVVSGISRNGRTSTQIFSEWWALTDEGQQLLDKGKFCMDTHTRLVDEFYGDLLDESLVDLRNVTFAPTCLFGLHVHFTVQTEWRVVHSPPKCQDVRWERTVCTICGHVIAPWRPLAYVVRDPCLCT
jgi:hypothetical protein